MGRRIDRRLPNEVTMQAATSINSQRRGRFQGERTVIPGIVLMGVTLVITLFGLMAVNDAFESYPYLFLMPWILGLGIILAIPSVILYYNGKFTFADPLIFATWSYFFPAFVIGGIFF